jgi:hypothetical protein
VRALASEADGLILGRMGEVATCMSTDEKEWGKRGAGRRPAPFCGGSKALAEREGVEGPGFGAAWRGKMEEGSGLVRGWVGDMGGTARVWRIRAALTTAGTGASCKQGRSTTRDGAADR